ncbi:MAG: cytochrome c3 family protein [Steroidobacteraceae bacterium]
MIGLLQSVGVRAASIETLLMPGKVSKAHAKYEDDCSQCHDRADRDRQPVLCMDCHKDVAADIKAARGLHGRMSGRGETQCKACHSEHQGRDGDIVKFNPATFDHAGVDFRLEGAHGSVACEACHKSGRKWREAPSGCGACHRDDDRHAGQLGQDCADCHSSIAWVGARFDHDKTRFPLRDAHREVRCDACHLGGKYAKTPTACVACHTPDDVHRGSRGEQCGDCHTQVDWKTSRFDHERETGFALLGAHRTIDCAACHTSGDMKVELPRTCIGCHRADDSHAARFGTDCADCHGNQTWRPDAYDHAGKHQFALEGAHGKLDCHACHRAPAKAVELGKTCESCHAADNPHGAGLSRQCDSCHGTDAWRVGVRFDHDLTDWPLLGLHVVVGCAQCHATKAFADTASECVACHRQDDVHDGGLGRQCDSCHSPNGWNVWEFDHGRQTKFALTGGHGQLKCVDCHRQPAAQVKLKTDCVSCHRKDDRHLGQFGAQCQRCHTTISFKGARIQ